MKRVVAIGLGIALMAPALPASPTPGIASQRARDSIDRAGARLEALRVSAAALNTQEDANAAAKIAAWQALHDAASGVRAGKAGGVHPLAGVALTHIGSLQSDGGNANAAIETWQRAVTILAPNRDAYAPAYALAVGSLAQTMSGTLGKSNEAIQLLGQSDAWYAAYLAKIPADRRTSDDFDGEVALAIAYGEVLSDLSRYEEAVRYKRAYWDALKRVKGPFHPDTNAGHWAYASELFQAGKSEEAEQRAREAVQIAVDHIDPKERTFSQSFSTLAILLVRRGKRLEALDYIRRSIELRRASTGGGGDLNPSIYNLGDVLTALERYDEARQAMLEAARGWRTAEGDKSVRAAIAYSRAGIVAFADGRVAEAAEHLSGAAASARAVDPKEQRVSTAVQPVLSLAYHDLGRSDEARRLADANVAALRTVAQPYPIELAVAELASAYLKMAPGGSIEARAAARRVVEIERSSRDIVAAGELAQGDRTAVDIALRVAAAANDTQLALDAMVVLAGSKVAQANRLVASRLVTADPVLATRIRQQQDAARAFKAADSAYLKALVATTDVAGARKKRDEAAARLATIRSALARDFPTWTDATGTTDPDLALVQKGLARQEAILAIVPAFDGVYTLVITPRDSRVRRTPLGRKAIVDLVGKLRGSLAGGTFDTDAASLLHEQFFPAADAGLLKGVTSLRIVPAGVFATLPFGALLERPVTRMRADLPWLIKRFAITVAPGFAPLAERPAMAATDARFLGVGAPTPFGAATAPKMLATRAYFRSGAGNAEALGALPALPGSAAEIATVARDFGRGRTQVLTGDDASEARLKALDLRPYSTILFATHGLVSGEMEGVTEPALVLARPQGGDGDGLLTASEVAALKLDADWVILSACNTAAGDKVEAPAYSGLAQAFRYAGARSLLLSHWPIRDDAAAFVTVATLANARKGMRRDVALQQAMLKLMTSTSIPGAAEPYLWAPYILLGDTGG